MLKNFHINVKSTYLFWISCWDGVNTFRWSKERVSSGICILSWSHSLLLIAKENTVICSLVIKWLVWLSPTHCSLMFWTNWNEQRPSIMRSTLAGKNMRIIVGSDILTPNGLTIDHKAEKLYFSDGSLGKIERSDYDGSSRYVSMKIKTLN